MNSDEEIAAPAELVIIKRRSGGDEDGHHGGAWKIAYADFMTAMMAFFLVMWLVNSTDDDVTEQLANYFNPIKLNDRARSTKGLNDVDVKQADKKKLGGKSKDSTGKKGPTKKADPDGKPHADTKQRREQELFEDPGGVLAALAIEARGAQRRRAAGGQSDVLAGPGTGDTFRDPFAPAFLQGRPAALTPQQMAGASKGTATKDGKGKAPRDAKAGAVASFSPGPQMKILNRPPHLQLRDEIMQALAKLDPAATPNIEVTRSDDGLLVSITDEFDFGMFEIASARPRPELVLVMEKLASVLKARREKLIIRGHTDGRPFRSKTYDNWRLSTARAHITRHMLLRGGVAEARIVRIEGHADHRLKLPANPYAAQNRRIEILLPGAKR